MAVMSVPGPIGDPAVFTRDQRDALPDDGRRHEIIDGSLVVTPAPQWQHQRAIVRLISILGPQLGPELELLCAPFDVTVEPTTVVQPDVLIARTNDLTARDLPAAPLLAIEVLSPSTRRYDLTLKRAVYEEMGCRSYWVVDPQTPSIRAWHLNGARYGEPVLTVGDSRFTTPTPTPLTLRPSDLI